MFAVWSLLSFLSAAVSYLLGKLAIDLAKHRDDTKKIARVGWDNNPYAELLSYFFPLLVGLFAFFFAWGALTAIAQIFL